MSSGGTHSCIRVLALIGVVRSVAGESQVDALLDSYPPDASILEILLERHRRDLFEGFLPFMDRHVVDHEIGGFMCNTDRRGRNLIQDKSSWYEGRGIWVYSFIYTHLDANEKYLEIARKSVGFILELEPEAATETWPRSISREGEALSGPCPNIYGDLFIAEGLAEYSVAVGDKTYWDHAKRIALKCLERYDRPDYLPGIGRTYLGPEAPPIPGARILGHWMIFLRLVTQMLRTRQDAGLEMLAHRCVDAILDHHHNPEFDLTNEIMNHDLSLAAPPYDRLVYTGHALETFWMVLDEAVRREDGAMFERVARRFRRHIEAAWDDVHGGLFRKLQDVGENIRSADKVLWVQEEALVGALLIYERTGESWAWEMFSEIDEYVQAHYPLAKHGFPLWISSADQRVTFEEKATRVENFHHPRYLALNILALERHLAR